MKYLYSLFFLFFSASALFAETIAEEPLDTDSDGYRNIKTLAHLRWLSEKQEAWSEKYELDNSIDASETSTWNVYDHDDNPNTPDSAMGWYPIANYELSQNYRGFTGEFNGKGNAITGIYINRPNENIVGFFASIHNGAKVENLTLDKIDVSAFSFAAGFCAYIRIIEDDGEISIRDCSVFGKISANNTVGLFSGVNQIDNYGGTINIKSCTSSGEVFGKLKTAGFTAANQSYSDSGVIYIDSCFADTQITGVNNTAGFCAHNLMTNGNIGITNSHSMGSIKAVNYAAGFVDINETRHPEHSWLAIENCTSKTDIDAANYVAGFCGQNKAAASDFKIIKCMVESNLKGYTYVAGFCYENLGVIEACIANTVIEADSMASGFCSINKSTLNYNSGVITKSVSTGNIKALSNISGFCLLNIGTDGFESSINNCYTYTFLEANKYASGFLGRNNVEGDDAKAIVKHCYARNKIFAEEEAYGFCIFENDNENCIVENSYWDINYSEIDSSNCAIGLGSEEMKAKGFYTDWDFENIWDINPDINDGYPFLRETGGVADIEDDPVVESTILKVYPNPVDNYIILEFNDKEERDINVSLVDILGAEFNIYTGMIQSSKKLDLESIPTGAYFIKVQLEDKIITQKILKR